MRKNILLFALVLAFLSCSDPKSELLKCNKSWDQRNEFEKLIGSWCSSQLTGLGTTAVSQSIEFQTKLCIYSDHTLMEYQTADSFFNSESEMDSGTDVQVKNGVLTYNSKNYGVKSYKITCNETSLTIDGFLSVSGYGSFTRCN